MKGKATLYWSVVKVVLERVKESDKKDAYEISSTLWWRSGVEGRTIEQEVLEARLFNLFQSSPFHMYLLNRKYLCWLSVL